MKTDERVAALVALVEADLAARTRALVEPASRQAREELRAARRAARMRVRTAIAEERAAWSARVGAAQARLATSRRMALQRRLKALLAEGWERMPSALAARWRDPEGRRRWMHAALEHALAIIPPGAWRIEAAAPLGEAERAAAGSQLAAHGIEPAFVEDGRIEAGLRIASGNVELDATLAGLLCDRGAIEGRLLHFQLRECA